MQKKCEGSTENKIEKIPLIGLSESVQSESRSKEHSCGIIVDDKGNHFLVKGFLGKIRDASILVFAWKSSRTRDHPGR